MTTLSCINNVDNAELPLYPPEQNLTPLQPTLIHPPPYNLLNKSHDIPPNLVARGRARAASIPQSHVLRARAQLLRLQSATTG